jgi:hypothetical protein
MRWNKIRHGAWPAAVTAMAILTGSAQADLLLYEPFDYAVGTGLGGNQGGTATEPVGYTNASSGTTWSAHQIGAGYNSLEDATLTSGSLSYANLATSGNSVNHGSGLAGASSKYATAINLPTAIARPVSGSLSIYMSFLVRLNSQVQNNGVIGNRFGFAEFSSNAITPNGLPLSADAQSTSSIPMPGTVWVRPDITLGEGGQPLTHSQFGLGKSGNDGISADGAATWMQVGEAAATAGSTRQGQSQGEGQPTGDEKVPWSGQTYFVVAKYTFNDSAFDPLMEPFSTPGTKFGQEDSVSIFINPLSDDLGHNAGEASAVTTALYSATGGVGTATSDSNTIASFVLLGHRQAGATNGNASAAYTFDELRIGTTWADVSPTAAPGQPGDHNGDGVVDAADYVAWRKLNIDGAQGYDDFVENFGEPSPGAGGGAVPEPSATALLLIAMFFACWTVRR